MLRTLGKTWLALLVATGGALAEPLDYTVVSFRRIHVTGTYFSEGAGYGDLNRDGHADVVSGPYWYAGPEFTQKHDYYPPKPFPINEYADNFFSFVHDLNGDGWNDILMLPFPGQPAVWFENPQGAERHWTRHIAVPEVGNESPTWTDLTGDGKPEVVCSLGGYYGYASPDWDRPTQVWRFHRIGDQSAGDKFTHGLGVGDVNGDGRMDLLERRGWLEQPQSLAGDPQWTFHPFPFTEPGGSQMFAYDLDGDGDNDVVTSLNAHAWGLAWFEQISQDGKITFRPHRFMGERPEENDYGVAFSQLHALDLFDMDGDGIKDIVTGKTYWAHHGRDPGELQPAVLYWFKTVRQNDGSVHFVPYQIDNNSGIGRQVMAGDINGDGLPDIVVGNTKGTFVHLQSRQRVSKEVWEQAQPKVNPKKPKMARGLNPQEAARHMTVPDGFRVSLVAGEPRVHQPIAITFDHRGRIWVAEAYGYPHRAPEGEGKDKIVIFEDADGNGDYETRKVFRDNLNLVSGLEVGFGGVWVGAAPYLLFIPDRDGDDRPDSEPEVLLDGFGYQDTHETLNAFTWGPDGWLYGCHGVFTHSEIGKPGAADDQRARLNAGVWRYHPTKHRFEVFAHGTSNPWGVDFDDQGQMFITACVIPHLYHVIQGGRYQRQAGQHFDPYVYDDIKTIADHHHYAGDIHDHAWWGREPELPQSTSDAGGGHAHCGAMIYLGDNWPAHYRNHLFMHNIHGNRVNMDELERRGSGYVAHHGPDFLLANDKWFRGISLKYGPDGAVYLIDWYDKNACHRIDPTIWDRTSGRIYRVGWGDAPAVRPDIARCSDAELVELQTHENDWYVRMARRVLHERAAAGRTQPKTQDQLWQLIQTHRGSPTGLRALWALHVSGGLTAERLHWAMDSGEEFLQAWAIQLALEDRQPSAETLRRMTSLASADVSPVVRLYLAAALQRLPLDQRWEIAQHLVSHSSDADDQNLPLMIWYGVEPLVTADASRSMQLARMSKIPQVARYLIRRAGADNNSLPLVVDELAQAASDPERLAILDELLSAFRGRVGIPMPARWPDVHEALMRSANDDVRQRAMRVAVALGDERIFPLSRQVLADGSASLERRQEALTILVNGRDPEAGPALVAALGEPVLRAAALRALAAYSDPTIPEAILRSYGQMGSSEQRDAISTLCSRPDWSLALLEAISQEHVPRRDLSAYHVRQIRTFDQSELDQRITAIWGSVREASTEKQADIAKYKSMLTPEKIGAANPSNGRRLFVKMCASCHRLFNEGDIVGPDITGSNRADLDYLLENLLDPSAVLGQDYRMTVVQTEDGRVIQGLVQLETDSALTLRTLNDTVLVAKGDIENRMLSTHSLMPDGLLAELAPGELFDLVAYLGSPVQVPLRGPPAPIEPETGRVAAAIEGETMTILAKSRGEARSQKMDPFPADKWSGDDHLWWTGAQPGDTLTLELPVTEDGRYEPELVMTQARDYAIVQVTLDGMDLGGPIDLYNEPDVITTGVLTFEARQLEKGTHRLGIQIVGANPRAVKAYMFGLDYVCLKPQTAIGGR